MLWQETLLPNTRALPRSTVDWKRNARGFLVRFRNGTGITRREQFREDEYERAQDFFWKCCFELESQAKGIAE
jgi:hypothetical protein